jgi:hypothetical protein
LRLTVDRKAQGALVLRVCVYFDAAQFATLRDKYVALLVASLFVLPVLLADAWITSARYAGPLHRVRQSMRELAAGKQVAPLRFRARDHWHGLALDFNAVLEYVEGLKASALPGRAGQRAEQPEEFQSVP